MKGKLSFILFFYVLLAKGQVDTIISEYDPSMYYANKIANGYHIIKKRGVVIQEFKFLNGSIDGIFKEYYNSGKIKLIANLRHPGYYFMFCGIYKEYYESGNLKIEGNYQYVDTIDCVNCFDCFNRKEQKKAYHEFIRVGLWCTFHENGQLESKGIYNSIHVTHYTDCEFPANKEGSMKVFCAGGTSIDFLKDKEWEYYSKKGNMIKLEYYYKGTLAEVKTYTE